MVALKEPSLWPPSTHHRDDPGRDRSKAPLDSNKMSFSRSIVLSSRDSFRDEMTQCISRSPSAQRKGAAGGRDGGLCAPHVALLERFLRATLLWGDRSRGRTLKSQEMAHTAALATPYPQSSPCVFQSVCLGRKGKNDAYMKEAERSSGTVSRAVLCIEGKM